MDISNISAMYQNYNQTAAGSATGNQISQLRGKDMSQIAEPVKRFGLHQSNRR